MSLVFSSFGVILISCSVIFLIISIICGEAFNPDSWLMSATAVNLSQGQSPFQSLGLTHFCDINCYNDVSSLVFFNISLWFLLVLDRNL